jgi:hypothetical protein
VRHPFLSAEGDPINARADPSRAMPLASLYHCQPEKTIQRHMPYVPSDLALAHRGRDLPDSTINSSLNLETNLLRNLFMRRIEPVSNEPLSIQFYFAVKLKT